MNTARTQKYLLVGLAVVLVSLVGTGFAVLLSQSRQHDRTLMEFQALQAAASLTEYYARSGEPDERVLPENVLGFGLYDARGDARAHVGSAPQALSPETTAASPISQLDRGEGVLRLLRPVGIPRTGGTGPMNRMPDHMDGRRMGPGSGGMMGRSPGQTDREPAPQDPQTEGASEFLLVDYDVSSVLSATRTRMLYWSAIGVALFGLIGFVAVLSRRIRGYEQEQQRREHLVQLGEAARTLAHEIKNPLGAIRLQTAMLRKQAAASPQLDILDEEIGRIDTLVNEVRAFLRDPNGSPETVDLCEVVQSAPQRYSFPIALDLRCACPCEIRFDRHRLHSVLGNVLRNAAETTDEHVAVELRLAANRESVVLTVADRGPGLPEDAGDDRAFDPFYTRKDGGFGVGLAVSRRFVEAAGGTITLQNRTDGPGAECIIILPQESPYASADRR